MTEPVNGWERDLLSFFFFLGKREDGANNGPALLLFVISVKEVSVLMMKNRLVWLAVILLAATLLAPRLLIWLITWPADTAMGTVPLLNATELQTFYHNRTALVIGGTAGVGLATALVLAQSGCAVVTVVGRRAKAGAAAVQRLQSAALDPVAQEFHYLQGDIGSRRTATQLVVQLCKQDASQKTRNGYDFLVVSAGIFPDWNDDLVNEDGLEKSLAIAVVGRFLLYRNMLQGLVDPHQGRVLNILASGMQIPYFLQRDMIAGVQRPTNFPQAIINMNTAHELMLIGLQQQALLGPSMRMVSTHPGILASELHKGQGWAWQAFFWLAKAVLGMSEQACGVQQASILASNQLPTGQVSYVDMFGVGRKRTTLLQPLVEQHLEWLFENVLS